MTRREEAAARQNVVVFEQGALFDLMVELMGSPFLEEWMVVVVDANSCERIVLLLDADVFWVVVKLFLSFWARSVTSLLRCSACFFFLFIPSRWNLCFTAEREREMVYEHLLFWSIIGHHRLIVSQEEDLRSELCIRTRDRCWVIQAGLASS